MVILLCNNLNIHFGNQFSSRKWWIPTSRHTFQVRCPSFGMCCMMTTVATYIWGTNFHLENGESQLHDIHLGNQFSSRKWWNPNFTDLITWSGIDFQQKTNKILIIVLLGGIDFMSLFQTRPDSSSSKDHTCHDSCLRRQMKFMLSLPTAGNLVSKQVLPWLDIFKLPHDRLFHRSYFSSFQYLIKSWTSLQISHRA